MTRGELKIIIKENLREAGITDGRYQDAELNQIIQDAYNDVAMRSRCIIRNDVLTFEPSQLYYDFKSMGVDDYMGYIAILNENNNCWLSDDLSLEDLDRIRPDWENWTGQPEYVVSHSLQRVVLAPYQVNAYGTYRLVYWASAPILGSDSGVFEIATDSLDLLEDYVCGTLLEDDHEISKGLTWLADYESNIGKYKRRCADLARTAIIRRI